MVFRSRRRVVRRPPCFFGLFLLFFFYYYFHLFEKSPSAVKIIKIKTVFFFFCFYHFARENYIFFVVFLNTRAVAVVGIRSPVLSTPISYFRFDFPVPFSRTRVADMSLTWPRSHVDNVFFVWSRRSRTGHYDTGQHRRGVRAVRLLVSKKNSLLIIQWRRVFFFVKLSISKTPAYFSPIFSLFYTDFSPIYLDPRSAPVCLINGVRFRNVLKLPSVRKIERQSRFFKHDFIVGSGWS